MTEILYLVFLIFINDAIAQFQSLTLSGYNYDSPFVRTVAFPVQAAYLTWRSWPSADTVSHVNFDQWSGDMAVGSRGLVAIHA